MGLPPKYMWLIFIGAIVVLCLVGLMAAKYLGRKSLIVFVGGDDDRLSLSKLQAFAWTLTVMSSYFAAMAVHKAFLIEQTWIEIPAQLLALMGIVIGSAGFSSVISAVKEEQRSAEVTGIDFEELVLTIHGHELGQNRGAVRIVGLDGRRWELSVSHWENELVQVKIDSAKKLKLISHIQAHHDEENAEKRSKKNRPAKGVAAKRNTLIVDTQNGKACYRFDFDGTTATLRAPIIYYEFVDLFRDDRNPSVLSIMKYQMFAWTIIALVIYVEFFLSHAAADIAKLPSLDRSVVILTGLSQAGYLGGKAAPTPPPG